jgi:glutaredoxin
MHVILYSTVACHLCEQAKEILWPLMERFSLRLEEVDIAVSDELLECYGVRIPVVKLAGSDASLDWPFDTSQLEVFLSNNLLPKISSS